MKVLYHKNQIGSILLHIPVGSIAVILGLLGYISGFLWLGITAMVCFTIGFLTYEIVQMIRKKDKGYPEIAGFCWGIFLMMLIVTILACMEMM